MKKKILFIMMFFITLTGSYKEETKAANSLNVVTEALSSSEVPEPPIFTVPLQDQTVQAGYSVTLTAYVVGRPTPDIEVRYNGQIITDSWGIRIVRNEGIISITIGVAIEDDSGVYSIHATNSAGTATTACMLRVIPRS